MADLEEPANRARRDNARVAASASLNLIPWVGGSIASLVDEVWKPAWTKRVEDLFGEIEARLSLVEGSLVVQNQLRDAVVSAIPLAAREAVSSDAEKIGYLANAVANVIVDDTWEHDAATTLLRTVGELTASHIRVLALLDDPLAWEQQHGIVLESIERDGAFYQIDVISDAFARLGSQVSGLEVVLQDLESKGLLDSVGMADEAPQGEARRVEALSSKFGKTLVRFVTWDYAGGFRLIDGPPKGTDH